MILGSVGSSAVGAIDSMFSAASAVVGSVSSLVVDYPLAATAVAVGAYECFGGGSNNPAHLGQNIDTRA
jgi:hypothetical protein